MCFFACSVKCLQDVTFFMLRENEVGAVASSLNHLLTNFAL